MQHIAARPPPRSLHWLADDLVDILGSWRGWSADGVEQQRSGITYGRLFDRALVAASGRFQLLYASRGTKALLLEDGRPVREINRSFYHAEDFDFPVTMGALPDGREVLVHCPDRYCELVVEDLMTGVRLTSEDRQARDIFHSQLELSPDGRHLLAVGWVWHPYGVRCLFDLEQALDDVSTLNRPQIFDDEVDAEVAAACWLDSDRVVISTTAEEPLDGEQPEALQPRQVGVWSISGRQWLSKADLSAATGAMITRGEEVVTLLQHPRLLDPTTGTVLAEWPEIATDREELCFGNPRSCVVALHPDGRRLAVAQADGIAVIDLPEGRETPQKHPLGTVTP